MANLANLVKTFYMFVHKCTVTLPLHSETEASECTTEVIQHSQNTDPTTKVVGFGRDSVRPGKKKMG